MGWIYEITDRRKLKRIISGCSLLFLGTMPLFAQEEMNKMWGEGQQAKEITAGNERGHLFEWGTMPCLYTGDFIRSWEMYGMARPIMA